MRDFFQFFAAWKVWHNLFHDFIWLDWVLLISCLFAVLTGLFRGFGFFWAYFLRLLCIIFAVLLISPPVAGFVASKLKFIPLVFLRPFFFLAVLGGGVYLIGKLSSLRGKGGTSGFSGGFGERMVGALSGFFIVLLTLSFATQFFLMLPSKSVQRMFDSGGARYGTLLRDFTPRLIEAALFPVRGLVNQKVAHS